MAYRRSNAFNADVNQDLLKLIEGFQYDPYTVQATSGYRPGDKRQHGRGNAIDIEMIDPKSGQRLGNYQDPRTFGAYQQYANALYQHALKTNPELAAKLRWGGYFSGGKGKYGALDLMHFDIAGGQGGIPMGGGSWESGLTPEQAKIWGLQSGSGAGQVAQQMAAAGYSPDQIRKAFLSTIASGESPGYDVMYGGQKFSDYSRHPHKMMPIVNDQGIVTGHVDVAGRYQFKGSTWDEQQKKYGYKDFSPENQDLAAWNYANDIYKAKTGGSLEEALKSGDPGRINAAAQALNQTWTSLPGGKEQSKGYGNQTFADIYNKALGAPPAAADSPSESAGGPGTGGGGGTTPPTADADKDKPWWKRALGAMAKAGTNFGDVKQPAIAPLAQSPAAAVVRGQPMSPIDPQAEELKRQQLAAAMARLNSGKLWG